MKTILFIHQSSDLYGSSKTLLYLVAGLKENGITPIVVLPEEGPLFDELKSLNVALVIAPVLKISRKMFGIRMVFSLPRDLLLAIRKIDAAVANSKVDVVYSNTLAVFVGIVYARLRKIRHIWHVHEIIQRPQLARFIFTRFIASKANTKIIYNSNATRVFWEGSVIEMPRSAVVLNGVTESSSKYSEADLKQLRENVLKVNNNDLVIALVGRINRWKGQHLLLEAMKPLLETRQGLKLVFVGSAAPGQHNFVDQLAESVLTQGLTDRVRIIPFQTNIWPIWQAIDVAVVPSLWPEPFGLVSVEAMLCSKPVIAADHGGLSEIVVHNETGLLFEPGNVESLRTSLKLLIDEPDLRSSMGKNGLRRARQYFSTHKYVSNIEDICRTV